jgi:glutamate/aspartate transport system substrate-binding protein
MKRTLCLTAALFLSSGALAQEGTLKKIKDTGSITMGYRDASVPFSYYDDKQQPVGYSVDLCLRVIEGVKRELKMQSIKVNYQLVTGANRIPLMANGTIDLECGSTTNTVSRQEQVWFATTHFVTATRFVTRKSANMVKLADLKGKTVVAGAGSTNLKVITEINVQQNMGMNIISANGQAEGFQIFETGRAVAFLSDDILLYSFVAQSRAPNDYVISNEALSVEPYAIMVRKDDAAFKKLANDTIASVFNSGEINKIYEKWFLQPIPPRNINLNVPMSEHLKRAIATPTDSGDPTAYR